METAGKVSGKTIFLYEKKQKKKIPSSFG